jgi:hypothetical protein
MKTYQTPTTDELRAAFNRAPLLHLRGWTFERACAAPLVLWALNKSALATRQTHHPPAQPRLI